MLDDGRAALTADEKYEARLRAWREPERVEFASLEAAAAYAERTGMVRDVLELRQPARVPISPWAGLFPVRSAGMTAREAYYDTPRLAQAFVDYHMTYRPDTQASFMTVVPAAVLDLLDYRMYDWPGHGTDDDSGRVHGGRRVRPPPDGSVRVLAVAPPAAHVRGSGADARSPALDRSR
jgi:hypothetical protein